MSGTKNVGTDQCVCPDGTNNTQNRANMKIRPYVNNLPEGWDVLHLENVVDILDSQRVPVNATNRELRQGKVPYYYGATGQVGWIDNYLFDEELILLGEDGAPFLEPTKQKAYIIRGKSWVNNHAHVLRARNGIPNAYMKWIPKILKIQKGAHWKMPNGSATIVQKLWNYCNVLRDDGMSYGDYVEQLTYLLFLKMSDERSKLHWSGSRRLQKI
jgi:hypothetical protein